MIVTHCMLALPPRPRGATLRQPLLLVRGEGGRAAQRRFFEYHNLSFASAEVATWPHFMQQQSEMRWVRDLPRSPTTSHDLR